MQLQECIVCGTVPECMSMERTAFVIKENMKGNAAGNYRLKTCLEIMWIALTGLKYMICTSTYLKAQCYLKKGKAAGRKVGERKIDIDYR